MQILRKTLGGLLAVSTVVVFGTFADVASADETNTYYVSVNGGDSAPYANWADAATDIQTAIDEALGDAGPGTNLLVLVSNGVYTLSSEIDLRGGVTLRSLSGRDATVIDGGGATRCLSINDTGTILDGFTVSNGYVNASGYAGYGAGIRCTNALVQDCTITRNTQGQGYGGGVYARNSTFTNCEVSLNVNSLTGGRGGGFAAFITDILDCLITSNQTKYGGGFYGNRVQVRDCEISYNYASSQGGGAQTLDGKFYNCLVIGNQAANYGGLHLARHECGAVNCTVVGNYASTAHGGIYATFESSRYAGVTNTIAWGNQAGLVDSNISGYTNEVVYSCATELDDGVSGNRSLDPSFADWNASYGYGNSHTRGDYTLALGSVGIDSATNRHVLNHDLAGNARPEDGDGANGAEYDMGCYEAPDASAGPLTAAFSAVPDSGGAPLEVVFTATLGGDTTGAGYQWIFDDGTTNDFPGHAEVTNTYGAGTYQVVLNVTNASAETASATNTVSVSPVTAYVAPGGGHVFPYDTWSRAATNIQTAVDAASATVIVSNGTYAITNEVVVDKAITIVSTNGRDVTIIDGGYPIKENRCVRMIALGGATLDGFTVRGGLASDYGGGIYCQYGTVQNCTVISNYATSGGGGVYLANAATLRDSTVSYNGTNVNVVAAAYGAGVYMLGGAGNECVMSNCTVLGNISRDQGGGVYGSYASIKNCRIEGNKVARSGSSTTGGGLYITTGVTMEDSVIVSNTCLTDGGGLDLRGQGVMINCLVVGNEAGRNGGGVLVAQNTGSKQRILNCTIVGNKAGAGDDGGGVYMTSAGSGVTNSIIYYNQADGLDNDLAGTYTNVSASCSPDLDNGVDDNITATPVFNDAGSGYGLSHTFGDYELGLGSPCIDVGITAGAPDHDLNGDPRPEDGDGVGGAQVDMGCYEAPDAASQPLSAGFLADPREGAAPLEVSFSASVAGNTNGLLYRWDFGDGNTVDWTADGKNVTNTYAAGTFDVTLVVSNDSGKAATNTELAHIVVYPPTVYVSPAGTHVNPFNTWTKAATNIQDAINAAGEGISTVLVTNGLYRITNTIELLKGVDVQSVNGRDVTVISGSFPAYSNRCLHINDPLVPTVRGFTISNGFDTVAGGGAFVRAGVLADCSVMYNRAGPGGVGGGVYASNAVSLVRDCTISHNITEPNGNADGVYNHYATVSNCIIELNGNATSYSAAGVYGNYGTVTHCTINSNQSKYASGFHISRGEIRNCVVSYNWQPVAGGNYGGGGILWYGDGYQLLVYGNEAQSGVGGVHVLRSSADLESSTVVGNKGSTFGGVYAQIHGIGYGTVVNSIISGNQAGGVPSDLGGYTNEVTYTCAPELLAGVNGNVTDNPRFDNGGSGYGLSHKRGNYYPRQGSVCEDSGTNLTWMTGALDLDGEERIQGGRVNMGAFENIVLPSGTIILLN